MRTSFIIILLIALATSKRIEIRSKSQKNLIQKEDIQNEKLSHETQLLTPEEQKKAEEVKKAEEAKQEEQKRKFEEEKKNRKEEDQNFGQGEEDEQDRNKRAEYQECIKDECAQYFKDCNEECVNKLKDCKSKAIYEGLDSYNLCVKNNEKANSLIKCIQINCQE